VPEQLTSILAGGMRLLDALTLAMKESKEDELLNQLVLNKTIYCKGSFSIGLLKNIPES
jgi:hypothetical protein